jgi:hypothetical protein
LPPERFAADHRICLGCWPDAYVKTEEKPEEKQTKATIINAVSKFIDSQGWGQTLTGRIKGLLGQLHNVRVKDRLEGLLHAGHVAQENIRHGRTCVTAKRIQSILMFGT